MHIRYFIAGTSSSRSSGLTRSTLGNGFPSSPGSPFGANTTPSLQVSVTATKLSLVAPSLAFLRQLISLRTGSYCDAERQIREPRLSFRHSRTIKGRIRDRSTV